jgi:hypothetical protein
LRRSVDGSWFCLLTEASIRLIEEIAEQEQPIQPVQSLNENPVIQLFHGDLVDKGRENPNESVDAILARAGETTFPIN